MLPLQPVESVKVQIPSTGLQQAPSRTGQRVGVQATPRPLKLLLGLEPQTATVRRLHDPSTEQHAPSVAVQGLGEQRVLLPW